MNIGEKIWVVKGGIIIEPQNSKTEFDPRQYDITTILEPTTGAANFLQALTRCD
jgi:hypothetical protein